MPLHPPLENLTLLAEGPYSPSQLHIHWDTTPLPIPPHAQARIQDRWQTYLDDAARHNKTLFNAPITRLISASPHPHSLTLTLGPSDYQHFVVTTLRDRTWFQQNSPTSQVAALGNSVFLTHQSSALLGIRSPRVSAYASRAHVLGGVMDLLNPPTPHSILSHLAQEMAEELHFSPHELAPTPTLLALVRDELLAQPELIWQWESLLPLDQIATRLDPHEHTAPLIIQKSPLPAPHFTLMTPVARAAHQRWSYPPPTLNFEF